jgi:hypothetical protein
VGSRIRGAGTVVTGAIGTALVAPSAALAAGGSAPAGGGEASQIAWGTLVAAIVTGLFLGLVIAHRKGKTDVLDRLGRFAGRQAGLPPWAALPIAVAGGSLIIAVLGMYWDISIHLDEGRDPGPFANAAHYLILIGLFGITASGILAMALPKHKPTPTSVELRDGWHVPLGGLLMFVCGGFALSAFPMDDLWHRIFGQDVTLWGPTHLVLFGAAALSTVGTWILLVEGHRSAEFNEFPPRPKMYKFDQIAMGGGFLIALSTFQGEFDYAVPQFRLDWHPILLMAAASIGLVTARIAIGRGGALGAALFFILIRGLLSIWVGPLTGHTTLHFPLYLVEALVVEAVALTVARERPIRFGIYAGIGVGTFGLAAEWAWSHIWWELPWTSSMLPEAAIAAFLVAVAGGIIGGFIGRALVSPWLTPVTRPRRLVPAAALVAVGVFIWAGQTGDGQPVRATVELTDVTPPPKRTANATVRLDPANAAEDARWLTLTGWQGGGSHVDRLKEIAPGVYKSNSPIPLYGNWKTTLRLQKDDAVQGVAIYFPEDKAIPAPAVEAPATFTRTFGEDKKLLQREQKPDVSPALTKFAYFVVLLIGIGLIASLAKGLRRLDRISEQVRMSSGSEVHETKVGRRFERAAGDGNGNASGAGAKAGAGSKSDSS